MKLVIFFIVGLVLGPKTYCQQILALKKPLVYISTPLTVSATVLGYWQATRVQPYTPAQLQMLNRNSLSAFNQKATYKYNATANVFSDITALTLASIPAIMSLSPKIQPQFVIYNTVYAQCLLSTTGQLLLLKAATQEARPYAYNPDVPLDKRLDREAKMSFPSMHTAISAAACFYAATTYCLYYPTSKYKIPVWVGAVVLPMLTGYLRNQSGKHFYKDVAAGYAIGAANGVIFPLIFKVGK